MSDLLYREPILQWKQYWHKNSTGLKRKNCTNTSKWCHPIFSPSINQNQLRRKRHQRRREHCVAAGIFAHTARRCLHRHFFSAWCLDTSLCATVRSCMQIYNTMLLVENTYSNGSEHTKFRSGERGSIVERVITSLKSRGILLLWIINVCTHTTGDLYAYIHKSIREQIPNALSGRVVPLAYINGEWAVINVRRPPRGGPPDKSKVSLNHCQL